MQAAGFQWVRLRVGVLLLGMMPLWLPEVAPAAIGVVYVSTDEPDTGAGDRWRYDYLASGGAFSPGDLLEIRFEFGRYEQIEVADAPPDWLAVAFEPDLAFGDGSFAAQYDGAGTSAPQFFAAVFVWQDAGIPGPQQFLLYDAGGTLIAAGPTAPIPEPPPALLLMTGLGHEVKPLKRAQSTRIQAPSSMKR